MSSDVNIITFDSLAVMDLVLTYIVLTVVVSQASSGPDPKVLKLEYSLKLK